MFPIPVCLWAHFFENQPREINIHDFQITLPIISQNRRRNTKRGDKRKSRCKLYVGVTVWLNRENVVKDNGFYFAQSSVYKNDILMQNESQFYLLSEFKISISW